MFNGLFFRIAVKKTRKLQISLKTPCKTLIFNCTKTSWNDFETTFALLKITKILNIHVLMTYFSCIAVQKLQISLKVPHKLLK